MAAELSSDARRVPHGGSGREAGALRDHHVRAHIPRYRLDAPVLAQASRATELRVPGRRLWFVCVFAWGHPLHAVFTA